MRIALISPLYEAVPPKAYGGTERVVANLAEALTAKGHQVTVYANAESRVNADLVVCRDRSILTDDRLTEATADHLLMLDRVKKEAGRFDILHFHTEYLHFPIFEALAEKTVTTCHSRLDRVGLSPLFRRYHRFPLVSISESQRRPLPDANWIATIPHGNPPDLYRILPGNNGSERRDYIGFLGRIAPDKGIDTAIAIARGAGLRLKIAARINSFDMPYWEQSVKPQVDGHQIEYVGEIGDHEKTAFLNGAAALLFPIRWPEPFGLVMIEAMACGTPVIAYPCGSVREVIEDGVTGRIVESLDEAVAAVPEVMYLDRTRIRQRFENRFTSDRMADDYLSVYRRLGAPRVSVRTHKEVLQRLTGDRVRNGLPRKPLSPSALKEVPQTIRHDRK
jgi:glycosyltransferase involved in cell wall biosynthesis